MDVPMRLESNVAYLDTPQARQDGAASSNLFLPEPGIEYHDPGSFSSSSRLNTAADHPLPEENVSSQFASPFSRHLGRNRACASCRDRKLKCDGVRPICGQCARAWVTKKRSLKSKGLSDRDLSQLEQPCSYLEVQHRSERGEKSAKGSGKAKRKGRDVTLDSLEEAERERSRLEAELADVKQKMLLLQARAGGESDNNRLNDLEQRYPNQDELSIAEILATTMRSGEGLASAESRPSSISSPNAHDLQAFVGSLTGANGASQMAKLASASLNAANIYSTSLLPLGSDDNIKVPIDPLLLHSSTAHLGDERKNANPIQGNNLSEVILSGWPADFPSPSMVNQLTRVFFDQSDYLRCLFQPGRFFQQLTHGPNSIHYPSRAVLHAIFSMGYALRPDLDPANISLLGSQRKGASANDKSTMVSSRYHCERAKYHILRATDQVTDVLSIAKAATILTSIKYGVGEIFEGWICSGIATKTAVAMSINRSRKTDGDDSTRGAKVDIHWGSLLPPPKNWIEEEERRRVMFMAFVTDQAGAASLLWTSGLKESDIVLELPMYSTYDFEHENQAATPIGPGQTLQSPDLFTEHLHDSFTLMIKGFTLVGRCGDFFSHLPINASKDHVKVPHWKRLNDLVTSFATSLPSPSIIIDDIHGTFDTNRFMTAVAIHTCILQLHEPLVRLDEDSMHICRSACHGMVNLLRPLAATGAEVTPLSPIFAFSLGLAGRVLGYFLNRYDSTMTATPNYYAHTIGLGGATGSQAERMLQNEIDLIFIFLCKYGRIWPIAIFLHSSTATTTATTTTTTATTTAAAAAKVHYAKLIAAQLGVIVESPQLLRHGIFTDRNNGHRI
ncbi:hypothetical protein CBS101457_005877 [Exobasidium rhododendri]|nr:hypothetical protein CBS101457_005877 [Exobasidium rhododendri]